ncbi:uncharacterized protein LOC126747826 [Anthonomus grandis grandis]|uniref:uncharacterized protein LOC126747826 n=1 Tax=Anthonomus grandis grandis TaxID=2921223 RepID=UPI002165E618|nr:uncharacterized protein LOC126747826 [Anthonomus grandis grandis]
MRVKCCTQVFSHQVASYMKKILSWNVPLNLDKDAIETANLIFFLDKLFDSLNSSKKFEVAGKPLKAGVSAGSSHISFWYEAIKILETMKYKVGTNFIIVPSIKNLIITIRGFIYLCQILISLYPKAYILTRVIQQDALENFFSCVRGYSGRENNPSVNHFITSFKALLTNNFMSRHSPGANCEEDETDGPLDNFKHFILNDNFQKQDVSEEKSTNIEENIKSLPPALIIRRSKIAKCTYNYISGFILRKMNKLIKCERCKQNMSGRDQMVDLDFIQARQYENCKLAIPGTYLNYLVSEALTRLFYLIPRVCDREKVSIVLQNILSKEIYTNLLNCSKHNDTNKIFLKYVVRCSLFFWCKKINLILKGKDEKFVKYLRLQPNKKSIDPIKISAYRKFQKKIKKKK